METLEVFLDGLENEIELEDIEKFDCVISKFDKTKKSLISRYKMDKFVKAFDKCVKFEKMACSIIKFYDLVSLNVIYFLLKNEYELYVNNFLKLSHYYIDSFIADYENIHDIIDILIKNEYFSIIITLIDNKLSNLLCLVNVHSKYSKNYDAFINVIKKILIGEYYTFYNKCRI